MPRYIELPDGTLCFPLLPSGQGVNLPPPVEGGYTSPWRVPPAPSGAAPVLAGTREVGTDIIVSTDQNVTSLLPVLEDFWFWYANGLQFDTTAIGETPNFPEPIGTSITMRHWWLNAAGGTLGDESNALVTIPMSGAVAFPAKWPNTMWTVIEDARSTADQKYVSFDPTPTLTPFDTTNFDYYFVCRTATGIEGVDVTGSTPITSATDTKERAGPRDAGTIIFSSVQIRRKSDGVVENATAGDYYKEQTLGGVTPPVSTFANITMPPAEARSEAIAQILTSYTSTGSHFNNAYAGRAIATAAMAAYLGDSASVTKIVNQINSWLADGGAKSSPVDGDYYAQHEMNMAFVAFLALRTPAVLSALNSATKNAALNLIIEAGMYVGAYIAGQQGNPQRSMRGRDAASNHQTNNPNISCANISLCTIGIIHFGLANALAKFAAFDKSDFAATLLANGLLGPARTTFVGANTGLPLHSSGFVTESEMNTWIHRTGANLTIRGRRIDTDMQSIVLNAWKHIFGADSSGAEEFFGGTAAGNMCRILPGIRQGTGGPGTPGSAVGVQHASFNNARRGFRNDVTSANYESKMASMPGGGEVGNVKEMDTVDGDQRSSASYSQGSLHMWTYDALALAIERPSWFDWRSSSVQTAVQRAQRGTAHMRWCAGDGEAATVGYVNCAKAFMVSGSSNNEDWWASQSGAKFTWKASFGLTHCASKWIVDSGIIPAWAAPHTRYNSFPVFAY